jgi:hypothetical protein
VAIENHSVVGLFGEAIGDELPSFEMPYGHRLIGGWSSDGGLLLSGNESNTEIRVWNGQWHEARNSLQRAIALQPYYGPLAHMILGMVLCQLGQIEQAREAFERSDSQKWPSASWPEVHGVENVDRLMAEARTLFEKTAGERGKKVPELGKAG